YWNTEENTAYIDAKDLPEPPRGKVYQVWSLTMQPLTPTSIGLLADFETDDNKVFSLENQNQSEAFGITLEPEGGSKTPTMDQLYVLGTVAAP
ncbi:MAG: anti-sigma factor, partial [Salegentibacter mishustinae]|nr:anti-sigma factor [Salegentibacter mishustinae]